MRESKPATDAVAAAEGRLRRLLYVVTSTASQGFAPIKEHLHAHLAYLESLEVDGKLFMAGPFFNEDPETWSGDGLLIYNASSFEEAVSIAEADPLHRSGARTFSIRPWLLNDGCLALQVRFSNQKLAVI
ncbi:MAG: YciI family protein [Isosphaeraceae bacterium]|nr:YciI family protein [Isosphaeraceae bacterium]